MEIKESNRFSLLINIMIWITVVITLFLIVIKTPYPIIVFISAITLGIMLIGIYSKLTLTINKDYTIISFKPFIKKRVIKNTDIKTITIGKYSPLGDFGGWGLRYSSKGTMYNVKGNKCICIEIKKGEKISVGTEYDESFLEHQLKNILEDVEIIRKEYVFK